jgi:hypothetical protein
MTLRLSLILALALLVSVADAAPRITLSQVLDYPYTKSGLVLKATYPGLAASVDWTVRFVGWQKRWSALEMAYRPLYGIVAVES